MAPRKKKETVEEATGPGKILACLAAIQEDIGHIGKDRRGKGGASYNYRGIDDVLSSLHPLLVKHGVLIIPRYKTESEVELEKGYRVTVTAATEWASVEDGSSVTTVAIGEGSDMRDKAYNKAMSNALKMTAFQLFCIPTEELVDSETDNEPTQSKVQEILDKIAKSEKTADLKKLIPEIARLNEKGKDAVRPAYTEQENALCGK